MQDLCISYNYLFVVQQHLEVSFNLGGPFMWNSVLAIERLSQTKKSQAEIVLTIVQIYCSDHCLEQFIL